MAALGLVAGEISPVVGSKDYSLIVGARLPHCSGFLRARALGAGLQQLQSMGP